TAVRLPSVRVCCCDEEGVVCAHQGSFQRCGQSYFALSVCSRRTPARWYTIPHHTRPCTLAQHEELKCPDETVRMGPDESLALVSHARPARARRLRPRGRDPGPMGRYEDQYIRQPGDEMEARDRRRDGSSPVKY